MILGMLIGLLKYLKYAIPWHRTPYTKQGGHFCPPCYAQHPVQQVFTVSAKSHIKKRKKIYFFFYAQNN